MTITIETTPNQGYDKPVASNSLSADVARMRDALDKIDNDMAAALLAIALRAPLANPVFTGTVQVPTPTTGDNTNKAASTAFVAQAIGNLIGGAPGALDTLNELATALNDDANFAANTANALALKLSIAAVDSILSGKPTAWTGVSSLIGINETGAVVRSRPVTVNVSDFADGRVSGDDWTSAIQAALGPLEVAGGGICQLPSGTLYLSIAESIHADSCLVVPPNVTFQGAGMACTIIQRLPSERGDDGVLITNKGWDTTGGYGADGNIIFQDFTITDGAASPQRTSGDLIGIGHCENIIVQWVNFGVHDQHGVDICGCKRVKVLNCIGLNEHAGGYNGSATIQIDGVGAGAIQGIYVDSTVTTDVEIAGNHFVNKTTDILMHVGHKNMLYKNIDIHNNYFDGAYSSGNSVIACDNDAMFENVHIKNNTVVVNNGDARGINFFVRGNSSEVIHGLEICGNKVRGEARVGIYAGSDSTYTGLEYPDFTGLIISGNTVDIDCSGAAGGTDSYCIRPVGFIDAHIYGNSCTITQDVDDRIIKCIWVDRNKSAVVTNNSTRKIISSPGFTAVSAGINVEATFPDVGPSSIIVENNTIIAPGFKWLLNLAASNFARGVDNIVFSANVASGIPDYHASGMYVGGHIYEEFEASDGTNFRTQVDFGGGVFIKTIASGQFYTALPLCGKKRSTTDSILSAAKVELVYAPLSATDFDADVEELNFAYLSGTTCAGTFVCDINQPEGTFSIVTGSNGVSCAINNASFQPALRTGGYLKAFTSL